MNWTFRTRAQAWTKWALEEAFQKNQKQTQWVLNTVAGYAVVHRYVTPLQLVLIAFGFFSLLIALDIWSDKSN
jgi:hypothetical protein